MYIWVMLQTVRQVGFSNVENQYNRVLNQSLEGTTLVGKNMRSYEQKLEEIFFSVKTEEIEGYRTT